MPETAVLPGPTRAAPVLPGAGRLDQEATPPPDLVIEVEDASGPMGKLAVSAGLGVPGIWHCPGNQVQALWLGVDRTYAPSPRSRVLPSFPMAPPNEKLREVDSTGATRAAVAPPHQP